MVNYYRPIHPMSFNYGKCIIFASTAAAKYVAHEMNERHMPICSLDKFLTLSFKRHFLYLLK